MNIFRASLTVGLLIGTSLALVEVSLAAEPVSQPTVTGISAIDLTAPRTLKEAGFLTQDLRTLTGLCHSVGEARHRLRSDSEVFAFAKRGVSHSVCVSK